MKQIAIIFFIVYSTSVFAQFSKGDKMLNGEVSFFTKKFSMDDAYGSSSRETTTSIGFYSKFEIFVTKNLALGTLFRYSLSSYVSDVSGSTTYTNKYDRHEFTVGLYEDKYFQVTKDFFFSLLGSVRYNFKRDVSSFNGSNVEQYQPSPSIEVNFSPGLIFFLTSHWALTGNLGSVAYFYETKQDPFETHLLTMNIGSNFAFGVSYYFKKIEEKK